MATYIGKFQYHPILTDTLDPEDAGKRGTTIFTLVATAPTVMAATSKFRKLISTLNNQTEWTELLKGATEIYLDGICEIKKMPKNGFMAYIDHNMNPAPGITDNKDRGHLSAMNIGATDGDVDAYDGGESDEGTATAIKPFITLTEAASI